MMGKVERARLKQLEETIPDVWSNKKVLYVGAYKRRFHFSEALKKHKCVVDVLEIKPENCKYLRTLKWLNKTICGNVINVKKLVTSVYDMTLWSHGPPMIQKKHFKQTIMDLLSVTRNLCVLMGSWGNSPDTSNITALYKDDYEKLGFKTSTLGKKNQLRSNLLAWKYRKAFKQ